MCLYKGNTELQQVTPEKVASSLMVVFYTVIVVCTCVFFLFALDYALDTF